MMLHPATAHFAMVLPVVASVFGLIYLFTRTEGMSKISSRVTLFAALFMIAAWYTGNQAGPQIYDYLSAAGQHELVEHKELGLYLAIALGIVAVLKMIGCRMKKFGIEALAILLLLGVTGTTFVQGKHGGELVYNYGMPFKYNMIEESIVEAQEGIEEAESDDEKIEIYEDLLDDIQATSEEADKIYGNPAPKEQDEDEE